MALIKFLVIIAKLIKKEIEVRPIVAGNFTRNKVIEYMDYEISGELINADYVHENGFFVGNHSKLIDGSLRFIISLLNEIDI